MKKYFTLLLLIFLAKHNAQIFSGEIFIRDNSSYYLNQVYVTNITQHKTVLTDYLGTFHIPANPGDLIRFTSIITDRKDIEISQEMLVNSKNFIELKIAYYEIQEVIISKFKPTGNLRKDVNSLKNGEKNTCTKKIIGLPEPKGDGTPPQLPVVGFSGGGLTFSIESIYDILSGERKKKERYYAYEKMNTSIANIKNYFGKDYFLKLKIPENLIENFLQFVYSSDNLQPMLAKGNFEATQTYIEKYLPIYQKRLAQSNLMKLVVE